MNTDISGDLSGEEIDGHIAAAGKKFSGYVNGFFNSRVARYALRVTAEDAYLRRHFNDRIRRPDNTLADFIFLEEQFDEDWHNFIPKGEWKYYERQWRGGLNLIHYLAFLFPYHNLALIVNNYAFERELRKGESRLRELGYTPVRRDGKNCSFGWCRENKLEVLRHLRNSQLPIKAADPRANKILEILRSRLEPESFTFGVYTANKRRSLDVGYPYWSPAKEVIFTAVPVRRLVSTPAPWADVSLEGLCKGLPLKQAIGLTSEIRTKKGTKHIPMIDFDCVYADGVYDTLDRLQMPGIIVASGKSFHFYGFELLGEAEWRHYIEKIRNMGGIDRRWSDLQLEQGYSMLRLTPARGKLYQPCLYREYVPKRTIGDIDSRRSELALTA